MGWGGRPTCNNMLTYFMGLTFFLGRVGFFMGRGEIFLGGVEIFLCEIEIFCQETGEL